MTQINLTWTKSGNGSIFSKGGSYEIRREGGYYNLYELVTGRKLNTKRMNQKLCKELAEQQEIIAKHANGEADAQQAERELGQPAATFKPFLTDEQNAEIDHALSGTTPLPEETAIGQLEQQLNQAETILVNGHPEPCEDFIRRDEPAVMPSAESRTKKDAKRPSFFLIDGKTYPAAFGVAVGGTPTVTLVSPEGNQYGLTLKGKESTCSCPSFEYRKWCKHLTAVLGERNAIFGVGDGKAISLEQLGDRIGRTSVAEDGQDEPGFRLTDQPIRNVVNAPMPRPEPMRSAESRKKMEQIDAGGGFMVDVVESERESVKVRKMNNKVKPSNTESNENSTPSVIRYQIAQEASTAENCPTPLFPDPEASGSDLDAGNGLPEDEPDVVRDDEPKGRGGVKGTVAKPGKVFTAALETLQPGTEFRQGRFRGILLDVNSGHAKVKVKEAGGVWAEACWAPATMVKVGETTDDLTASDTMVGVGRSGQSEGTENGGSVMKVQRAEYELLLGELGLPAAKTAKMSAKELHAKLAKLPEKAAGKDIADEGSAKLCKRLLKAVEDGEEVEIVEAEKTTADKPVKEGKGKKAAGKEKSKVSANGNGHAGNGSTNGHAKAKKTKPAAEKKSGVELDKWGARVGSRKAQINALLSAKTPKTIKQLREEGNIPGNYADYLDELAKQKIVKGDHKEGWVLIK